LPGPQLLLCLLSILLLPVEVVQGMGLEAAAALAGLELLLDLLLRLALPLQ
jgi:hypothetical protein